jgi:hypothetical protein
LAADSICGVIDPTTVAKIDFLMNLFLSILFI